MVGGQLSGLEHCISLKSLDFCLCYSLERFVHDMKATAALITMQKLLQARVTLQRTFHKITNLGLVFIYRSIVVIGMLA